jgi:hypothetical protein
MAQMTWRADADLVERVRRQAAERGYSLNEWVTVVLAAASDPAFAGDAAEQLRERLHRAGLLDELPATAPRRRPDAERLAAARAAAGRGTALSDVVAQDRR